MADLKLEVLFNAVDKLSGPIKQLLVALKPYQMPLKRLHLN